MAALIETSVRTRLEQLIQRSTREVLDPLQSGHERLVRLEQTVARLEHSWLPRREVEPDAVRHAELVYRSTSESARLTLAGLAGAEQWIEASTTPERGWFDQLNEQFPGLDPSTVSPSWQAGAANTGALMLYRGFRGEQIVAELLVGLDVPTPPGFTGFSFADSTNNPGWDVTLHTAGGDVRAQVKVAADADAIRAHFENHPDVKVVYATSDAAQALSGTTGVNVIAAGDPWPVGSDADVVVDIGRTSSDVGSQVSDALAHDPTLVDETLSKLPLVALCLVAARVGYRLLDTDDEAAEIARRATGEAKDVMINAGAGEIAALLVGDAIGGPVTIATALGRASLRRVKGKVEGGATDAEARIELLAHLSKPPPKRKPHGDPNPRHSDP